MKPRLTIRIRYSALLFAALASVPGGVLRAQESDLTEKLISEMESVFGEGNSMVTHTMTVMGHAMEIQGEEGGDAFIVQASAILHDIGIPRAREVHGSSSGEFQEMEGPPIAREILTRVGAPAVAIDHICGNIANHHSDRDQAIVTTLEFKILWDADWLVNFPGRNRDKSAEEKALAIEEIFKTTKGKAMARQMFLGQGITGGGKATGAAGSGL